MSKKLEILEKLYGFKRGDGYSKYSHTLEEREQMFNMVKNAGYKVKGDFEPNSNYIFRTKQMIFAPTNVGRAYFKRKYNAIPFSEFISKFSPTAEENDTENPGNEDKKLVFRSIKDNSNTYNSVDTNLDKQYENWFADSLIKGSYNYEK